MIVHPILNMRLMLACRAELDQVRLPVWGSAKLDGIRASVQGRGLLTRSLELVPNHRVQAQFACPELFRFDGELGVGSITDPNLMQHTQSVVMSSGNPGDVVYYVFDLLDSTLMPYEQRYAILQDRISRLGRKDVVLLEQRPLASLEAVEAYEEYLLGLGYEGMMLRQADGEYRSGRRSMVGQQLMKVKRFTDGEGKIVGFEEMYHNLNPMTRNAQGLAKRSSSKAGKVPAGMLGKFIVEDVIDGRVFPCAGEISLADRIRYWQIREELLGQYCTFTHFDKSGVRNMHRLPVFKSIRSISDFTIPKKTKK